MDKKTSSYFKNEDKKDPTTVGIIHFKCPC